MRKQIQDLKISLFALLISAASSYHIFAQDYPDKVFQQTKFNNLYNISATNVTVHPEHPDTIFTTTSGGVYKTFDGGDNWSKIEFIEGDYHRNNAEFWHANFHPDSGNVVYASDAEWLYKSTDCGDNWKIVYQGEEMMNDAMYFAFGYNNPSTIYIAGINGIWKSENAGSTWTKIREKGGHIRTGSGNSLVVLDVQYDEASFICVTTDDFLTCDTLANELPPYSYVYDGSNIIDSTGVATWGIQDVLMDYYADGRMLLSCNDGGLFESDDFGETWQKNNSTGGFIMKTDPKDSTVIYSGQEYSVFKSEDRGNTWQKLHQSHNYVLSKCHISVSSNEVYFVGNLGIEYMDESGQWSRMDDTGIENVEIHQIFASDNNPYITLITDKLHVSTDNGQTWTKHYPSTPDVFTGLGVAYIGGIKEMEVVNGGNTMFLTGWAHHNGTLFKSTDYGANWQNISPYYNYDLAGLNGNCIAVNPNNADTIFVNASCADSCVFRTIDGGSNWEAVNNGLDGTIGDLLIDHQNPKVLYAIGSNGRIFKTEDAGESWTVNHTSTLGANYGNMQMNPYNSNEIIAMQAWTNILAYTNDAGQNWLEIEGNGEFFGEIIFDYTENSLVYYATINGDLHKSLDTLKTWQNLTGHINHSENPKGYNALFKEGNTFLAGIGKSGLYSISEIQLDSTISSPSVNCLNDSTGQIAIYTDKYYTDATYSIDKGITTQNDSIFTDLPEGNYFPVVIIGQDTLSKGEVEITRLQQNFVSLGDDVDINDDEDVVLDASDIFEAYLWNEDSDGQTLTVDGSTIGAGSFIYWVQVTDEFSCNSSDTITVNITEGPTSGIEDNEDVDFCFYPNPVQDIIYINKSGNDIKSFKIIDLNGQLLMQENIRNNKIDISHLVSGTYIIQFNNRKSYSLVKL